MRLIPGVTAADVREPSAPGGPRRCVCHRHRRPRRTAHTRPAARSKPVIARSVPTISGRWGSPLHRDAVSTTAIRCSPSQWRSSTRRWRAATGPMRARILKRFSIDDETPTGARVPPLTIVGVAADVAQSGLETEIRPEFYLPHAQVTYNSASIPSYWMIRTAGDPSSVAAAARGAIHAVDSTLARGRCPHDGRAARPVCRPAALAHDHAGGVRRAGAAAGRHRDLRRPRRFRRATRVRDRHPHGAGRTGRRCHAARLCAAGWASRWQA